MNKQELIEKIRDLDKLYGTSRFYVDVYDVLELVELLDKPEKVKVPQFVAEVMEGAKEESPELEDFFRYIWFNEIAEEFTEWYGNKSNRDLFVRAWLDGYEVEKEPRYTVKVKSTKCSTTSLVFSKLTGEWFFSVTIYQGVRFKHTRKELEEAGFGWVFSCEGIEIEEVE